MKGVQGVSRLNQVGPLGVVVEELVHVRFSMRGLEDKTRKRET